MTVTEPQHNKVLIHASGLFADTKLLLFCAEESQWGAGGADLMRGMSWMVQQVLGKPGRGSSSVHVTLYDLQQRHREFSVHDLINQKCWLTTSFSSDWRREITHQFSTGQTWWFITAMAYLWAGTHHLQRGITRVSDSFYIWTTVLKNKGVRSAHKLMKWTSWSFFCVWSELFSLLCSWPGNKLLVCLLFCLIAFKHNQRNNQTFKLHIDFVTNSEYVVRIYIKKKLPTLFHKWRKSLEKCFNTLNFLLSRVTN